MEGKTVKRVAWEESAVTIFWTDGSETVIWACSTDPTADEPYLNIKETK